MSVLVTLQSWWLIRPAKEVYCQKILPGSVSQCCSNRVMRSAGSLAVGTCYLILGLRYGSWAPGLYISLSTQARLLNSGCFLIMRSALGLATILSDFLGRFSRRAYLIYISHVYVSSQFLAFRELSVLSLLKLP